LNVLKSSPALFTPNDRSVVFPNNDTLYSTVWLDLRREPMVLTVPPVPAPRYHSLALTDGAGMNYGLVGSRTGLRAGGHFLVAGPDWQGKTPPGITQVFRSPTQFSLALFRLQVTGAQDIDAIGPLQAGYQARPLSAFAGNEPPPAAPAIAFPKIDRDLARQNFFQFLDFQLRFQPMLAEDRAVRDRLAELGIGIGRFDRFKAIAARYGKEIAAGMAAGEMRLSEIAAKTGPVVNGWSWVALTLDGDRARYTGDYIRRAALFRLGPYGLPAAEAVYPITSALAGGEPLDAGRHRYTLTFPAGELPPADAFWSLSLYDGKSRLLVANALDRYVINSPMLPNMARNADGSLTIHIQNDSPGAGKESNWLPAADGPITLVLRLYGPQEAALNGKWKAPPVVRVE
jgi:hypothetical protein